LKASGIIEQVTAMSSLGAASILTAGLCEKTQEADNEVGGIAATNYSSCGECFGVILARIAWEDIGLIKR